MITSKRHPLRFYLTIAFATGFLWLIGYFLTTLLLDILDQGNLFRDFYPLLIAILILFVMGIYIAMIYFKRVPIIRVGHERIKFGRKSYCLNDIQDVYLLAKVPFNILINYPMEGMAIRFRNGDQKLIFTSMYSNSWKIRLFLQKTVIEKVEYQDPEFPRISSLSIRFERFDYFKSDYLRTIEGVSLWLGPLVIAFILYLKAGTAFNGYWFIVAFITILWILINGYLLHYVGISDKFLVIKSPIFTWYQRIYKLENIREIVLESNNNRTYCIRVITTEFKSRQYPAGALTDESWQELITRLKQKGISVRDEIGF